MKNGITSQYSDTHCVLPFCRRSSHLEPPSLIGSWTGRQLKGPSVISVSFRASLLVELRQCFGLLIFLFFGFAPIASGAGASAALPLNHPRFRSSRFSELILITILDGFRVLEFCVHHDQPAGGAHGSAHDHHSRRRHDTASGGENRADLCLWAGCDRAAEASQRLARETERETACDGCGEVAAPSSQCKRERQSERARKACAHDL